MLPENCFLKFEENDDQNAETMTKNNHSSDVSLSMIPKTLNQIFPPREINEGGKLVKRYVSAKPASLFEIYDLQNIFQDKLKKLEKEITGFSSEIREIHHQLFEELIRQETIDCPERGQLLKSILDEQLLTLDSVKKNYKSTFSYAVCKSLLSRRVLIGIRNEIPILQKRIQDDENERSRLFAENEEMKRVLDEKEYIKTIEQNFLENQLERANEEMIIEYADKIDEEHKWLKDITETDEKN
ncbi:uncharacterized protein TNIN_400671 [Trichonephila inaurata madagascariensis]|uniref:Uncharacterized protein n=1 Tax=Trichonephila inaurata madagascariensis TaxID=2747483 RepID=A0A8X6XJH9_9ARAC|nr:uncharacterized protein TNIN_400671 [Trichonephila inaurata madagascariensis]